ncbi:MAG TPA: hypothetical protein VF060_33050 [Trebonia sp.]
MRPQRVQVDGVDQHEACRGVDQPALNEVGYLPGGRVGHRGIDGLPGRVRGAGEITPPHADAAGQLPQVVVPDGKRIVQPHRVRYPQGQIAAGGDVREFGKPGGGILGGIQVQGAGELGSGLAAGPRQGHLQRGGDAGRGEHDVAAGHQRPVGAGWPGRHGQLLV